MSALGHHMADTLRNLGPVIDVPGTKALYAPLLADMSRDGVVCEPDRVYGEHARHRLDVYAPSENGLHQRPVLVFIHGGGFIRGDKSERDNVAHAFAKEGYVVVVPNYRLAPEHRWPAGAEDVREVLRWVGANVSAYGGDPRQVVLAGESAGAAHVAASRLMSRFVTEGIPPKGAVLISGVYNARLEGLARAQLGIATPDPRNEAYFGPDTHTWGAMSTVDLVDVEPFPLLITYAEMDPPQMQIQAGELFARLVTTHHFSPDLHVVRGHNHLSQLYAIGTEDRSLLEPMLRWMKGVLSTNE